MNFLKLNLLVNNDWITAVFLIIFLLLGISKLVYKERLFELTTLFFSKKYILKYNKESQPIFNGFSALLFIVQVLILSLITLLFFQYYKSNLLTNNSLYLFFKILTLFSVLFLLRYLLGVFLSMVFDLKQTQQQLAFVKMNYLSCVLILILPFLLLTYFVNKYNFIAFQSTIALLSILLIIRYVFIFRINKNLIVKEWYNFFLYLCALEIAPLLLLLKTII